MKIFQPILLLLFLGCMNFANAQRQETGFLNRTVLVGGVEHNYQVYLPRGYSASQEWPVILFLHGGGERGSDGLKQTDVGLGRAVRFNPERWPAIVVFPQAPESELWQGETAGMAMAALDATTNEFSTDDSRIYLTGMSLGGNGTWYLGYEHTDRFAAFVAICSFIGFGDRLPSIVPDSDNPYAAIASRLADKAVWIVHGDADVVVSVEESRTITRELEAVGADVTYTELPGVNHNSWDAAYANEELIEWLFDQRL